jgi:hypothetical protein
VTDYGKLADKLKSMRTPARPSQAESGDPRMDPAAFYEMVKAHIVQEMEKANVELRKRKLGVIDRIFLPSFEGKLCLTYGSELLCTVDVQPERERITAVITGPPNAMELSKKEFLINEVSIAQRPASTGGVKIAAGYSPRRIAGEIVSGLMMREFA